MRLYKIFKDPMNQYEAVKQGWSWPAFFFWAMWACVKQMWGLGIRILVTFVVLSLLAGQNELLRAINSLLGFSVFLAFGMFGNTLREKNLVKRGYVEVPQLVNAANPEAAIAQYIAEYGNK